MVTTTYTLDQATQILSDRASLYGGELSDILNITPMSCWDNPDELVEFWEGRDLSHIFPQSTYPSMANDWTNIIPEDPSVNRSRGADIMTSNEEFFAHLDNDVYADTLDITLDGDSYEVLSEVVELATA